MPDSIRNAQSISSTDERTPDQSDVLAFHYSLTAPKDPCFVVFSPAQDQYQFAVSPSQTLVLWVKGDGSGCHLHVSIVAADGLVHQWTVGYVNWTDWRKIEIKLTPGGDGYDVWGPSHPDAHEAHPIIAPAKFNALSIERQDPHFPTGMLLIGGIGLESGQ